MIVAYADGSTASGATGLKIDLIPRSALSRAGEVASVQPTRRASAVNQAFFIAHLLRSGSQRCPRMWGLLMADAANIRGQRKAPVTQALRRAMTSRTPEVIINAF